MARFVLIKAVAQLEATCRGCRHSGMSPRSALKLALQRYAKDPEFVEAAGTLFRLPLLMCGVMIGEDR